MIYLFMKKMENLIYRRMFTYLINSNDLEINIINNEYPYMK